MNNLKAVTPASCKALSRSRLIGGTAGTAGTSMNWGKCFLTGLPTRFQSGEQSTCLTSQSFVLRKASSSCLHLLSAVPLRERQSLRKQSHRAFCRSALPLTRFPAVFLAKYSLPGSRPNSERMQQKTLCIVTQKFFRRTEITLAIFGLQQVTKARSRPSNVKALLLFYPPMN